jgi:hypothetical protein
VGVTETHVAQFKASAKFGNACVGQ